MVEPTDLTSVATLPAPVLRTSVFVDFWNIEIDWEDRQFGDHIDWFHIGATAARLGQLAVNRHPRAVGRTLAHGRTVIVSSLGVRDDARKHLFGRLKTLPGYDARFVPREPEAVRCRGCRNTRNSCDACRAPLVKNTEKGADQMLITKMLEHLIGEQPTVDLVVLLSTDTDFLPALQLLRKHNVLVVVGRWSDKGTGIAGESDGVFYIDEDHDLFAAR